MVFDKFVSMEQFICRWDLLGEQNCFILHVYFQPDEVYKTYHEWVVVRDMMEPEPAAAWRVLECDHHENKLAFWVS